MALILLDLDGTLVDPGPGIIGSCRHGLLWGYADTEELETAGATILCARPGDLPDAVAAAIG